MTDRIFYITSNLSAVPCESSYTGPVPATAVSPSTYYHIFYKAHGQTQLSWHGETYCLIGGYRAYGDAPLPISAEAKEEKPAAKRAPKRRRTPTPEESDEDLGCPKSKIPRLKQGGKRLTPQKHAG